MATDGTSATKRRERFHGAFTGGFSAGFFNTVGSAEGWTPSSFSSSRDKRAAPREQKPEDFMDYEDGLLTEQLQAKPEFDTLGSTADEFARRHANREAEGSTIPGPAPSELVVSAGDSMGKKLLRAMGWKEGQGVGSRVTRKRRRTASGRGDSSAEEDLPQAARAGLGKRVQELVDKEGLTFAPRNTDLKAQKIVVKIGLHGIGYDPFKNAPEFGAIGEGTPAGRGVYSTMDLVRKKSGAGEEAISGPPQRPGAAPGHFRGSQGFILDDGEDDVYEFDLGKEVYDGSIDADQLGRAEDARDSLAHSAKAWASEGADTENDEAMLTSRRYARCRSDGRLPPAGFLVASRPDEVHKNWAPPIPPADFKPFFQFEENRDNPDHGVIAMRKIRYSRELEASGRGRLLGEAGAKVAPDTSSAKGPPPLSFMPPVARKNLLEAANVAHTSSLRSSSASFVPPPEASSKHRNKNLQVALAKRFTSESSSCPQSGDTQLTAVDGLDGSAGLTLRTSTPLRPSGTATNTSDAPSLATPLTAEKCASEAKRNPVRSTLVWRPAPLLCKRLNIPVPTASSTEVWASKGGMESDRSVFGVGDRNLLGLSGGGISNPCPRSSQPKVPLLHDVANAFPLGVTSASGAPPQLDEPSAENLVERPPIDLFRSIFESESESESESEADEGKGGDKYSTRANTETGSPAPVAQSLSLKRAPQASAGKLSHGREYGSDSSVECAKSQLPGSDGDGSTDEDGDAGKTPCLTLDRGSLPEVRNDAGATDKAKRESRSHRQSRLSGEKRKHKHKLKHKRKDKSKKHRKHEHKRKSSSSR